MDVTTLRPTQEQLSAAETVLSGRTSATVLAAMSPQQPDALIRAVLVAARRRDVDLTLMFADLYGTFAFLDDEAERDIKEGRLHLISLAGSINRRWSNVTDYLPYSLWDIDRMLATGTRPVDLVVARMAAGAHNDYADYGDMIGYTASALATNAKAIFEVIDQPSRKPFRNSQSVSLRRADIVLHAQPSIAGSQRATATEASAEQREIGRLVASLIPDEATLQLGLGSVAEAVVPWLEGKRNLGLHSGILPPSLNALIKSGVITGTAKSRDAGLAVATGVFGTPGKTSEEWDESVALQPISATHNPRILSEHNRLWAINSALEVDLAGQVNVEFVDGVRFASGGGQSDFVRAGHISEGGASVIALPSRTRHGRSRLVPRLPSNCLPNLAGQDVDFVVTEHGAARLRGLSAVEKANALIAVAHPDDRSSLRKAFETRDPSLPGQPARSASGPTH